MVRLCLAIPEVDTALVVDVVNALAQYNARTFRSTLPSVSPWHLHYNALAGDSLDGVVTLRDAVALLRAGEGACGELVAAYAGWLIAHGYTPTVLAEVTGPDAWHVVVRVHAGPDALIDPARPDTLHRWRNARGMW